MQTLADVYRYQGSNDRAAHVLSDLLIM